MAPVKISCVVSFSSQGTTAVPFCSLRWDAPHGPVTSPVTPRCPLMTPADSKLDQNRCRVQMFQEATPSCKAAPPYPQEIQGGEATEEAPVEAGRGCLKLSPPQPLCLDGAVDSTEPEPGTEAQSWHQHPVGSPGAAGQGCGRSCRAR